MLHSLGRMPSGNKNASPIRMGVLTEAGMRAYLPITMFLMLSGLPLNAQEPEKMDVGRGVLCDTPQQVTKFVSLRGDGEEANAALQAVNEGSEGAFACTFARVLFTNDKPLSKLIIKGRLVSIVQITVHAFGNGSVWTPVPTIVQYTATVEKGQVI
jgi:hypothetical protein